MSLPFCVLSLNKMEEYTMSMRKSFIATMFRRKTVLNLANSAGHPYSLLNYLESCSIKNGNVTVGYVQGLTTNGTTLNIDHFAVDPGTRNGIKADDMIRAFANLVKAELVNIDIIAFSLGRAGAGNDIQKLANARQDLLQRIGAVNVLQTQVNAARIVVSADWHKVNW